MVLGQVQVSAAAVSAGDAVLGAACCHLRSSLIRTHKLMARFISETETQDGGNISTIYNVTTVYLLHSSPPTPFRSAWREGSALRSAQEGCSNSGQCFRASLAIEAGCLFGFSKVGISTREFSFQHLSLSSACKCEGESSVKGNGGCR